MIAIFDYGAGNLRSVQNTLSEIGCEYTLVRDAEGLRTAQKIMLPGVGHFGQLTRAIDERGVRNVLIERIHAGVPFLGICLGMQALFEASDEAPEERGLGIFPGSIRRFPAGLRVPHMGWNDLDVKEGSKLLADVGLHPFVYFAHSYYLPEHDRAAALCTYSTRYTAAFEADNIFGVQFHPEKSGAIGLKIVNNFVSLHC